MNDHALRVYDSILGLLSGAENPTPLVRLNRVTPFRDTQVYAKLEWYNPFGAVKDRVAANLVADGEARRTVQADQQLVEPTSGNTGMALAMIALQGPEAREMLSGLTAFDLSSVRPFRAVEAEVAGVVSFIARTGFVEYEAAQADIFDHLIAILPEFGLRLFQHPAGSDFARAMARAD